MGAEAKNLEAIAKAIDVHNRDCPFPASAVLMNPFEVERLGWDEIRGLPVMGDPNVGTGSFRIVCGGDGGGLEEGELEVVEAVSEQVVPVGPVVE
jgi:hypothetical protein